MMTERMDWEELADKNQECRCFIEFAYAHRKMFYSYISKAVYGRKEEALPAKAGESKA
jgi:hypothetical protein